MHEKPAAGQPAPGTAHIPENIPPETLAFFQSLIDSFNQSAASLKEAYGELQQKFDRLNLKLEQTNRELSESLAEQERLSNYLTNILESLSSGVLVVDTDGLITLFNRGAETITGISGGEAVDRPYAEVMGNDLPEELTPLWALKSGEARSHLEKTLVSRRGENVPVGFSISPLVNVDGRLLGAVEIFMDLTRIKALEDELAWKEKLAALGQMSATMAHKIRNPLGGIVGYAGLLERNVRQDEVAFRQVRKIIDGVEKIDTIISNVLTYNAVLKLNLRKIDMGERINELIRLAKQELLESNAPRIGFQLNLPAEKVTVEADPDQFSAALFAILTNAVEAIDDEGTIGVTVLRGSSAIRPINQVTSSVLDTMRRSSRMLASRRPCGVVVITDTGCGMDESAMKNLFLPFFTTKEKGIGLGLALARKIIEAHQGEIWVESLLGQGTGVGIILPERSTVG